MQTSLPRIAEIMKPLQTILKERMHGVPSRTAKVTSDSDFSDRA